MEQKSRSAADPVDYVIEREYLAIVTKEELVKRILKDHWEEEREREKKTT